MKKLERDVLLADRMAVASLLAEVGEDDPAARFTFTSRLEDIDEQLRRVDARTETLGEVALMFGGDPVIGSRSIDADFATRVIDAYQDLIDKQVATDEFGALAARGPVRQHQKTSLGIREILRGSIGFLLEENARQQEIDDTPIKKAMADVSKVIANTASPQDQDFEEAIAGVDPRSLVSLKVFFKALDDARATIRIVNAEEEHSLDVAAIERGRRRIEDTEIQENESDNIVGELIGFMPNRRWFELRLPGTDAVISGRVATAVTARYLELIEGPDERVLGSWWRTRMKTRVITERNKPPRTFYTLVGLLERVTG
jgi:hypothetical protein